MTPRRQGDDHGFAPRAAGRNMSRTAFLERHAGKTPEQIFAEQTGGIDARAFASVAAEARHRDAADAGAFFHTALPSRRTWR